MFAIYAGKMAETHSKQHIFFQLFRQKTSLLLIKPWGS